MELPKLKSQEENHSVIFFQNPRSFEHIVMAAIFLCASLVVVYCIWTLDRGFEITDEAYYLLLAMHADSVKYYISGQQWVTGGIWQVTGSLAMFRAAGMFLLAASSSLLAFGAMVAFSQRKLITTENLGARVVVLAASVICAMLYAATINFSPCYNLLASAGAYAAVGLVLLALHSSVEWQRLGMLLLVGGALSIEFISKASAGLATLGLVIILVLIFGRSLTDKLIAVVVIIIGLILSVLAILYTQTTIQAAANSINQGLELFRMVQVESVGARLERYSIEFLHYSFEAIRSFAILIFIVVIYLITRRPVFIGFALASLVYTLVSGKYLFGGVDQLSTAITISPGAAVTALNYEPGILGGYPRIDGFERYSGLPSPSAGMYRYCTVNLTGAAAVGNTITGVTSGATGVVASVGAGELVITKATGTFTGSESFQVAAVTVGMTPLAGWKAGTASAAAGVWPGMGVLPSGALAPALTGTAPRSPATVP